MRSETGSPFLKAQPNLSQRNWVEDLQTIRSNWPNEALRYSGSGDQPENVFCFRIPLIFTIKNLRVQTYPPQLAHATHTDRARLPMCYKAHLRQCKACGADTDTCVDTVGTRYAAPTLAEFCWRRGYSGGGSRTGKG